MGLKDVLATRGPQLALMALAAAKDGPEGLAGLMDGIRLREQSAQQHARQQMSDARAGELHKAQLENMTADNERAKQAAEQQKLEHAIRIIQQAVQQQEQSAIDPVQAENAVMRTASSAASLYGLPPDQLTGLVPNLSSPAGPITGRKKKRAKDIYDLALATFGPEKLAQADFTIQTGEEFGDVKPAQLLEMIGMKAIDASGAPVMPATGKRTPPTPGSFEDFMTATPERQAEIEKNRKRYMQADDRPRPATGPDGLTPNARLEGTLKLRDRFIKETQAAQAVNTQLRLMKSSLEAVKNGAAAPGSQGVLVTFQKILDPTSVVRESEYARSASGLSLISRMEGAWDKIKSGGAGVPVHDLEQFVVLAEQFVRNQAQAAEMTRSQINAIAKESGLNPDNITRELGLPGTTPDTPSGDATDPLGLFK